VHKLANPPHRRKRVFALQHCLDGMLFRRSPGGDAAAIFG
jgi:hypothetical protein